MKEVYVRSRASWRKWLQGNHTAKRGVWLVLHKKNSPGPGVDRKQAVEEALCFGWIDSKPGKRDEYTYLQYFAPRKKGSAWSKINKDSIAQLVRDGRMAPAGIKKIEEAKKDGSWSKLDSVDALEMPVDLEKAFSRNKRALKYFNRFPPGVKKQIFFWVISAKRDETLRARISETVARAAKNERANQWVGKRNQ